MQYSDSLALDGLYEYCLPSYVAISIVKDNGGEGVGSGIIITEDGYICTNYHVVEGADKITVLTSDNKKLSAEYIDGDEVNDIAVIKVSAKNLTAAKLGSSANTKIGERVMAIGTPFSISYAGSMTAGYISGIDRQYAVKNDNGTVNKILKLIQTDTSVNPGNSGGPLFNMNGEVIGVVTLKIAGSNYEGMGFVLPIDGVKDMIFDIIENGKITDSNAGSAVKGAALGISGHAVEADTKYLMTAEYCIQVKSDDKGDYIEWSTSGLYTQKIYVTDTETLEAVGLEDAYPYLAPCTGILVKTTSAGFDSSEKLNIDDVIISANGIACDSMSTLQELIFNSRVGDVLNLEIYRNGATINVDVKLGVANSME
jgi:S1-C subfamily serine protease